MNHTMHFDIHFLFTSLVKNKKKNKNRISRILCWSIVELLLKKLAVICALSL